MLGWRDQDVDAQASEQGNAQRPPRRPLGGCRAEEARQVFEKTVGFREREDEIDVGNELSPAAQRPGDLGPGHPSCLKKAGDEFVRKALGAWQPVKTGSRPADGDAPKDAVDGLFAEARNAA
jgi:hypothetical protein